MARDTVNVVMRRLGAAAPAARPGLRPDRLPLEPQPPPATGPAAANLPAEAVAHLRLAYGARWPAVAALAAASPDLGRPIAPGLPYLRAQVVYAVEHEMALHLPDVLARRTHPLHEQPERGLVSAPEVAALMAGLLGWDEAKRAAELAAYQAEVDLTRR